MADLDSDKVRAKNSSTDFGVKKNTPCETHLFSAIHTVGGRNPKQPPGMYKTCRKSWDTLPTSTG